MKYLSSAPFSVGLSGKKYSDNWEETFGRPCTAENCTGRVHDGKCNACDVELEDKKTEGKSAL